MRRRRFVDFVQVRFQSLMLISDCSSGYSLFEGICIKCPASYIRFENTCYRYYHTKVSWYEARQTCIGDGGDLVSLNEHAFFDHIVTFTMTKGMYIV